MYLCPFCCTLQKGANFLHIACSEGSDKTLRHIIGDLPPLLPDVLKELFMATDKVSECIHLHVSIILVRRCVMYIRYMCNRLAEA